MITNQKSSMSEWVNGFANKAYTAICCHLVAIVQKHVCCLPERRSYCTCSPGSGLTVSLDTGN